MIFDTHCHYNLSPLKEHWKDHWSAAQEKNISGAVIVGTTFETSTTAVALAEGTPGLFAAIGSHPSNYHHFVTEWQRPSFNDETELDTLILKERQQLELLLCDAVIAIGETGLDYYRLPEDGSERTTTIALQQEAFSAQIELANQTKLPLIVHVRDTGTAAYWDTLELLKAEYQLHAPFVLHCVSGPAEYVKEAVQLGGYVGIAGNITYPSAHTLRDILKAAPRERLLLETDAPYLPPQSWRGKPCEPWMISETARFLQQELTIDTQQLYHNALTFFSLE